MRNYNNYNEGFNENRVSMKHEARRNNLMAEKEMRQFKTDKLSVKAVKKFKSAKKNLATLDFDLYEY